MKKSTFLLTVACALVGSTMAQMAIPGEVFAANPTRYNGRKVTIKNIEIVKADPKLSINGPASSSPGAPGSPSGPSTTPCRPPRGFAQVDIHFRGAPEYKGCFFMVENMNTQLDRECGHENNPAQITFRGDSRMGYHITMYRLGM
jgi:hypothetical protein